MPTPAQALRRTGFVLQAVEDHGLPGGDMPVDCAAHAVSIADGHAELDADLRVPSHARGLVIFAHGSGSSRLSSRNRHVAAALNDAGFATLLLDLLTTREESVDRYTGEYRFDIPRLARRVMAAHDWAADEGLARGLRVGCFGASTGAAAAIIAAAERPTIAAVVSRGGRPDLAGAHLPRVQVPTLLIVGGDDEPVIEMNEAARVRMTANVRLEIVPGATHLFEEPGALEQVSRLAIAWFDEHLPRSFSRHAPTAQAAGQGSSDSQDGDAAAMRAAPLPADEWDEALDAFTREHRAWLAHIERDDRAALPPVDRPLVDVRPEHHGSRVVAIRIALGMDAADATTVRIEEPVAVALETASDGTSSGLRIEDASGRLTRLRFRVESTGAMLDGLAPAAR